MGSLRIATVVVFVVLLVGVYVARVQRTQVSKTGDPVHITAWVHDEALAKLLRACEVSSGDVTVNVRVFRTEALLQQAVSAATTAGQFPHILEVSSQYDLSLFAGKFINPSAHLAPDVWGGLHESLIAYFATDGTPWAVPYAASIPVLFYNDILLSHASADLEQIRSNWDELVRAGQEVQAFGASRNRHYWGLVADRDVAWYWENIAAGLGGQKENDGDAYAEVFQRWRELIFGHNIMPALQQHRAMTDFVAGRAGFLMASSERLPLLRRHIGGRFGFGLMPFPQTVAILPKVHGLALTPSSDLRRDAAVACVTHVVGEEVAAGMWFAAGKVPARTGVVQPLLTEREGLRFVPIDEGMTGVDEDGRPRGDNGPDLFDFQIVPNERRTGPIPRDEERRLLETLELSDRARPEDVWHP